uniref:NADH-ubiquinone oxidoreductase chain 3 n=1 Tax=Batracomorphus lateprocessus TaxID=1962545 RepID=A0A6C0NA55_9HEMI|nr:NADH dehydrogenase subunit 3 [Batracomorphus lateprocessus]YP_010879005.1 NADH dehydrogenase subunit 3 [Batracomorphus matsumurai]QHW07514.1 NADH dehydrogenase subunit 3 [Batracomorphus lateprocessus]WHE42657.1 NADH dehydrogenase subunit 3 [Batracomorphus matsumurai]
MMLIMMFCMMILFILIFMSTFVMTLMKKKKLNFNKMSPFECGFNSMSNKRLPFSTHFFIIGIMFLIFDIEIIIIMPMILTMKMSMMKYWILSTTTMIMILIFGIYHEWKNGMLKWTK